MFTMIYYQASKRCAVQLASSWSFDSVKITLILSVKYLIWCCKRASQSSYLCKTIAHEQLSLIDELNSSDKANSLPATIFGNAWCWYKPHSIIDVLPWSDKQVQKVKILTVHMQSWLSASDHPDQEPRRKLPFQWQTNCALFDRISAFLSRYDNCFLYMIKKIYNCIQKIKEKRSNLLVFFWYLVLFIGRNKYW